MEIKVKRLRDGKIFTNNLEPEKDCIIEIHFCTSYTQVVVQEFIDSRYISSDLMIEIEGSFYKSDQENSAVFVK